MPNRKRVFIIHGWGGSPQEGWFPWLSAELEKRGFAVQTPEMPDTDNPKIEAWISCLQRIVGKCDENTFFVGHSIGCQAVMRYLEKLSESEKAGGPARIAMPARMTHVSVSGGRNVAGGAVFVAPWLVLSGLEDDEERFTSSPWITTPIDFGKVKARVEKIICIFSDDDPYVPLENIELFSGNLGAETIVEKNKKHFSGEDGFSELPVVLEKILKIAESRE
jgi:predicted alpha/beta hydrolase family esterase